LNRARPARGGLEEASTLRSRITSRLGFRLDPFQLEALDALDAGRSVLVSAPTGSGKTVVADYAVARTLEAGRRAFYTTPLKALSNQKFGDLVAVHGPKKVGLLTGDVTHQPHARVVVMTTEVLRNMIFTDSHQLAGLGLVVLDEVHYLQDPYRGSVWEEVIILTPPDVVFVCLSATVSNAAELGAWLSEVRGPTEVVVEEHRPIELRHHVAVADRRSRRVELIPLLDDGQLHPESAALDQSVARLTRRPGGLRYARVASPRRSELIEALDEQSMLPAIVFIFSRAACDAAVGQCLSDGIRLTTPAERAEIRRRCEEHTEGLADDELRVLGYGAWVEGLAAGLASHHAGLIPAFREAVEDCFSANLLRVVFATETLALGINMPARTVVIEKMTKIREHGRSGLSAGEYAQMTGRAGRRGLDSVGQAVALWTPHVALSTVAALATSPAPDLVSSFRPTYNLAVNLVRRYRADQAHFLLDQSFAQFVDRRHRHALARRLDRALGLLDRRGYVDRSEWRVTARGELLAGIYHECDLLVAEVMVEGLLDGLDPPDLAAVVSACTFESRPGRGAPPVNPPRSLAARFDALLDTSDRLRGDEQAAHLPRTRAPDTGFAEAARAWARGRRLEQVLERAAMAPGDFVRNAKQLVDLLRQLALVAPRPDTADNARRAAEALQRGVVAATTAPGAGVSAPEGAGPAIPEGAGPAGPDRRPRSGWRRPAEGVSGEGPRGGGAGGGGSATGSGARP
jgi:superfamily II RNA helicase